MDSGNVIPVALAIEGLTGLDARAAFELAADAGYRGVAFATNHRELNPETLGESGRRHLRAVLAARRLGVESLRAAVPRGGLADAATIDRTLEGARQAMMLARQLGVATVSLHAGELGSRVAGGGESQASGPAGMPQATIVAALRELAQQADAAGLTLAVSAQGPTEALARLLKEVGFDGATVNLDGARIVEADEDVINAMDWVQGRVGQWTATDAVRCGRSLRAATLGEGQVPVEPLMKLLAEQGFRGPIVVDVRDLPERVAGARRAAEFLHRVLCGNR